MGFFLVVCALLIAGGVILVSGYKNEERVTYEIEFDESVLGLTSGGLVEYLGVPVGTVSDIYVTDDNRAHVQIEIVIGKVTLRQGVRAELVIYSLATGAMAISLSGGEPGGALLVAGSEIPASASLMRTVSSQIETLLADIDSIASTIQSGLVGMEEGDLTLLFDDTGALIRNGQQFLQNANTTLIDVKDDARDGIDEFRELAQDVRQLVRDTNEAVRTLQTKIEPLDVARTEESLNEALKEFSELARRLKESADRVDQVTASAMHGASNLEYGLRETLRTLNDSLEATGNLVEYLQQDPSALVRGKGKRAGGE